MSILSKKLAIFAALIGAALLGATLVAYSSASDETADATPSAPNTISGSTFSSEQEQEIRMLVHEYLMTNPEVIIEAVNAYSQKQQALAEQQARASAGDNLSALLDPAYGYVVGAKGDNAKVAVIELYDYHCGFCKRATPLIKALMKNEDDVTFVFRELPILREESEIAAAASLAARDQDKFLDLHFAMMETKGTLDKNRIAIIAKDAGLDATKLQADTQKPEVMGAIVNTHQLAQSMGVGGTPAFIIASTDGSYVDVIEGFRERDIRSSIKKARAATQ